MNEPTVNEPTALTADEIAQSRDARAESFLTLHVGANGFRLVWGWLSERSDSVARHTQVRPTAPGGSLADAQEKYNAMYEEGGTPPAGIAHFLPSGKWEELDGYQRHQVATKRGVEKVPLYQVLSDDERTLTRIAVSANNYINGVPPTDEDKALQLLDYARRFPDEDNKDMARLFLKSESWVSDILRAEQTKKRLRDLGVDPDKLKAAVIRRLGTLTDDSVLSAAATFAIDASLTSDEVNRLVLEIGQQRSESGRLGVIKNWASQPQFASRIARTKNGATPPVVGRRPNKDRILAKGQEFVGLLAKMKTVEQAGMTDRLDQQQLLGIGIAISREIRRLTPNVQPAAQTRAA